MDDEARAISIKRKVLDEKSRNFNDKKKSIRAIWKILEKEQEKNERSKIKCVGLTIETRSDVMTKEKTDFVLKLGCTRVELGIQSVYDEILKNVNRGHGTKENIEAISMLRDHGFKLNFHMMPGLPGVSKEDDVKSLLMLFQDERYRPDMLKIYPCMVIEGTKLFEMYKEGKFKPLSTEDAAEIIIELKKKIPSYCRIMRVQRDIPTERTIAGVGMTNLRQYIDEIMRKENVECNCIRCKEPRGNKVSDKIEIKEITYDANGGTEKFIYAHDEKNDYILGFCRLRIPNKFLRDEITPDSALVRELHVYGLLASSVSESNVQHRGLGTKLLKRAEKIAKDFGRNKIIVISGVGVREYYRRKHGYKREGPYMVKRI
jgi:elongator complex protein 3